MRLVFIRHGETEFNRINKGPPVQQVIAGQFDTPLTELGRAQAVAAAERLRHRGLRLSRFLSSDIGRAVKTSEIIHRELKLAVPVELRPELRERFTGVFEGRKIVELKRKYPEYFRDPDKNKWRADFKQKAPGGENFAEVTERISPVFAELTSSPSGDVILVTHIRVICCAIGKLLRLRNEQTVALKIPNCEPLILTADDNEHFVPDSRVQDLIDATNTNSEI